MTENKVSLQKRAKRESLIKKELSKLFLDIKQTDRNLDDIYITNVELSSNKSSAHVLFFSEKGEEFFNEKLNFIILYKPSVRKALSQILNSKYTPNIIFQYDKTLEKQAKIEALLDKVKSDPDYKAEDTIEDSDQENTYLQKDSE
ncbi:MAG: Ribosome-binding factor A [candidate division TM6 bacterium GW2011_GWF2_30_66]|jgi:ribosome-binding factor A|nr:MAG: Ribosome-binding factor A [candidate division TM6 bacterium GW2011_GWF2_30_66]